MKKSEREQFPTLDLYLSAFLSLFGVPPKLETVNGRVVFVFPSNDDLYKLMANFNGNVNVPVADFVVAIKTLRGKMLSMRGTAHGEK